MFKIGPIRIGNWQWWKYCWLTGNYYGIFRNDHCVPGRWGFFVLGFEFGNRNPGSKFGVFLKRIGLWPW